MDLDKLLIQYATYNWKYLLSSLKHDHIQFVSLLTISSLTLILLIILCRRERSRMVLISKECQTNTNDINFSKHGNSENKYLAELFQNSESFRNLLLNSWISAFQNLQNSNTISQTFKLIKMKEINESCSQNIKITQMDESTQFSDNFSVGFRLKVNNISILSHLLFDKNRSSQIEIILNEIELKISIILKIIPNELYVKLCPESLLILDSSIVSINISEAEKEMSKIQFERDFRVVLMQTINWNWTMLTKNENEQKPIIVHSKEVQTECSLMTMSITDGSKQTIESDDVINSDDVTGAGAICLDIGHCQTCEKTLQRPSIDKFNQNKSNIQILGQNLPSELSLFTTESYWMNESGAGGAGATGGLESDESPFHDRISSILAGRTLVVTLMKVVHVQELRTSIKRGYCVLELDEPYQRHVSHLIPLNDFPVWNQHFVFSLNSNTQRFSVQLFHTSKKGQNVQSLGSSIITMSQIILDPTQTYYPINTHNCVDNNYKRQSWRVDSVVDDVDSCIPAFVIDFQIMKNAVEQTYHQVAQPQQQPQHQQMYSSEEVSSEQVSDVLSSNLNDGGAVMNEISSMDNNIGAAADAGDAGDAGVADDANDAPIDTASDGDVGLVNKDKNLEVHVEEPIVISTSTGVQRNVSAKSATSHTLVKTRRPRTKVINKLHQRISQLFESRSHSDECLDESSKTQEGATPTMSYATPTVTMTPTTHPDTQQHVAQSKSLSSSLKKVLNLPLAINKRITKSDFKDRSLEKLFKEMDPNTFDAMSTEGFERFGRSNNLQKPLN